MKNWQESNPPKLQPEIEADLSDNGRAILTCWHGAELDFEEVKKALAEVGIDTQVKSFSWCG